MRNPKRRAHVPGHSHGRRLAALTPFGTVGLRAEEPRYGLQLHANLPTGDLKSRVENQPAPGLGVHVAFNLGAGHVLQPRLDAVFFGERNVNGLKSQARDLSLGCDYLYFPKGDPTGLYLAAGVGLHRWTTDISVPAIGAYPAASGSDTANRLGYSVGLGYAFNRSLGVELRKTSTKQTAGGASYPSDSFLQLGLTYKF